jgi:hypothetical protein
MKQALISPNEKLDIDVPGKPVRVAQVDEQTFPVAQPLFWRVCQDDVVADLWYCNLENNDILEVPVPPPPPEPVQPTVDGAQTL